MSTLKVDNLTTTGGQGLHPARAWINYNSTGQIRASAGVSGITDLGTGHFAINFSSAFADTNGCIQTAGGLYNGGQFYPVQGPNTIWKTTSQIEVVTGSDSTSRNDWQHVYVAVFR